MSDLDSINYQAWICPACYDDHLQSQGCSKEITRLKSKLERVKKIAHDVCDYYGTENNWSRSNKALFTRINCTDVDIAKNKEVRQVYYSRLEVGGKLARTKKKELEELG